MHAADAAAPETADADARSTEAAPAQAAAPAAAPAAQWPQDAIQAQTHHNLLRRPRRTFGL